LLDSSAISKRKAPYEPETSFLTVLLTNEAVNKIKSREKAAPFKVLPGGVPVVVKVIICPAIKRMTGSMERVSKINGVNPGYLKNNKSRSKARISCTARDHHQHIQNSN
jgi:hypothetical protein